MDGRRAPPRKLHPEWNTALGAVTSATSAMERDALATTHPVVQHVETVEQANQAFDAITYQKGEAVIRMLEGYVGADAWRAGVRALHEGARLRQHRHRRPLARRSRRRPASRSSPSPTTSRCSRACRWSASSASPAPTARRRVDLTQGEFSNDRPDKKPLRWRVPVIARAVGPGAGERARRRRQGTPRGSGCGPVIVNAGQSGYYRTSTRPTAARRSATRFAALAPIDQLGLRRRRLGAGPRRHAPSADVLELRRGRRSTPTRDLGAASPSVLRGSTRTIAAIRRARRASAPSRSRGWRRSSRGSAGGARRRGAATVASCAPS